MAPILTTPYTPSDLDLTWPFDLDTIHRHNLRSVYEASIDTPGWIGQRPPVLSLTGTDGQQLVCGISADDDRGGLAMSVSLVTVTVMACHPLRFATWTAPAWYMEGPTDEVCPADLAALAAAGDPRVSIAHLCAALDFDAPTWDSAHRWQILFSPFDEGGPWLLQQPAAGEGAPPADSHDGKRLRPTGILYSTARIMYDRGRTIAAAAPQDVPLTTALSSLHRAGYVELAAIPAGWLL